MKKDIETQVIENYLKTNKLSKARFCKDNNFSLSTLNNLLKNNLNVSTDALIKLARIMKIRVRDLIIKD